MHHPNNLASHDEKQHPRSFDDDNKKTSKCGGFHRVRFFAFFTLLSKNYCVYSLSLDNVGGHFGTISGKF